MWTKQRAVGKWTRKDLEVDKWLEGTLSSACSV